MVTRNRKGQMERDAEQARLDAEACELRAQRLTIRQIAAIQNCSVSVAHDRIKRAIAAIPYEAVAELRRIELESLDELEQRCREVMLATHLKVDHGKLILIDDVPMIDDAPILHAAAQILRIKDMRAKFTGTYAPTKSSITVVTEEDVDAEIRRLEEEEAARGDSGDGGSEGEAPAPR